MMLISFRRTPKRIGRQAKKPAEERRFPGQTDFERVVNAFNQTRLGRRLEHQRAKIEGREGHAPEIMAMFGVKPSQLNSKEKAKRVEAAELQARIAGEMLAFAKGKGNASPETIKALGQILEMEKGELEKLRSALE